MTPWLGAFVALAENQGSVLSSHMLAHNWSFIPRGPDIFLSLRAPGTLWFTCIHAGNTHTRRTSDRKKMNVGIRAVEV